MTTMPSRSTAVLAPPKRAPAAWLDEAYAEWLDAASSKHPERLNRAQTPSTLDNYCRALRLLSYGAGHRGNLAATPAALLQLPPEEIGKHVERGASLEAAEKGKALPSSDSIRNMKSYARAVARCFTATREDNFQSGHFLVQQRKAGKQRPRMRYKQWPESLRHELETYQVWLAKPTLPPEQKKYRPDPLAERSIVALRSHLGQFVKWRLEGGRPCAHLIDLISEHELSDFFEAHLGVNDNTEETLGGYAGAGQTALMLAGVVRYLVATEQYDPITDEPTPHTAFQHQRRSASEREARFEACNRLRKSFYAQGRDIVKQGKRSGKHVKRADAPKWTPLDLRQIRDVAFHTPARRTAKRGTLAPTIRTTFNRKRSATMFGISSETPLRIRTLTLLRWQHLTKLTDGRWRITASGSILKVKFRHDEPNTYEFTYSTEVSAYIDEYRDFLASWFGPDFERDLPSVFPVLIRKSTSLKAGQGSEQTLAKGMVQLAAEVRKERFSPHDSRYIVATYCIRTLGAPGILLAAKLLGDKPETVLKHYVEELADDAPELVSYFKSLRK
ncbi:hypothetical protein GCM10008959_24370 [Deinococcus seoulensis]|uniref:Site-specific integrase n=1 Tax=Deinococcus seoulensis TaxID=1837379 RepID=A0ABQ2RVS2_9DEIO|nr:site-specific integrase [Deinococcus seoulensis]GGR61595.1 hypothetical protein GCM10008959_24370 [Deinococcus seoulensis]